MTIRDPEVMKTKTLIVCAILIIGQHVAIAQTVSKELATSTAIQYVKYSGCESVPISLDTMGENRSETDTTITRTISLFGKAYLYLVEPEDGWVLVSSELAANPILASAPTGRFPNYEDMPDGMKWLLSYYEDVHQYIRDSIPNYQVNERWSMSGLNNSRLNNRNSNILSRMAQVHWNQNDNNSGYAYDCTKTYNKFCPLGVYPLDHCGYTFVGCDAVAIGQVMWFHQWPYSALIPNAPNSIQGSKHVVEYYWNGIPTDIYNSSSITTVDAVASFLRDCGYANDTQYGDNGSFSNLDNDSYALRTFFHYNNGIEKKKRSSTSNWISKLKNEIDAGRPIIYRGQGPSGGHAFVLYGYDYDDKFYVNWGWGGGSINNISYSLDILEPESGYSFNEKQYALFYVEPEYPDCETYCLTNNDISDISFEVYNGGPITIQNKTISANQSGVIYSGHSITITSSFAIELGANVYLAIKDMHCDLYQRNAPHCLYAPRSSADAESNENIAVSNKAVLTVFPIPVTSVLHIQTTEDLSRFMLYDINGQLVLQTSHVDIDVSSLPKGIYILHAVNKDGSDIQSKIIKE